MTLTAFDFIFLGMCAVLAVYGLTIVLAELGDRVMRWIIQRWGS